MNPSFRRDELHESPILKMKQGLVNSSLRLKVLFQKSQLTAGRQGDAQDFFARNLRERIEMAQGFQFVTKKFEPHRPRAGKRPDIEDAAAQGDFAFLRDLGFRFAAVLFQPFDQVERIDFIAAGERARVVAQHFGREGFLQKRGDTGDNQG